MPRLSHTAVKPVRVGDAIERCAKALRAARVHFGHGTADARDEGAELVFFAAGLSHSRGASAYDELLKPRTLARINLLLQRLYTAPVQDGLIGQRIEQIKHGEVLAERSTKCGPFTFGFYIFEVTKIKAAHQQTLAQATPLIRQVLAGKSQTTARLRVRSVLVSFGTAREEWNFFDAIHQLHHLQRIAAYLTNVR